MTGTLSANSEHSHTFVSLRRLARTRKVFHQPGKPRLRSGAPSGKRDQAVCSFVHLRECALKLPKVEEGVHRGGPAFRVHGKTFALWWAEGAWTIMKLQRDHQVFLFEVQPDVFQACRVGAGTLSYVELALLEDAEVETLVFEAWATVAPRGLAGQAGAMRHYQSASEPSD